MSYAIHDRQSAPEASREVLEQAEQAYGFVPNLFGVLAESPAALRAYAAVTDILQHAGLDPVQQQVVMLTVSADNGCTYCVGAHSALAQMVKMNPAVLEALRAQGELPDAKLEALRRFTLAVMSHRGWVPEAELQAFHDAGYGQREVLDVITIVALKTLSNYTNHIAATPLDAAFAGQAWEPGRETG
ncbi:MAG: carboxymuconolactone decarboxylase [Gammaproteobacteria bacterium]|nr:carboxymuconolactone decarboxylase [Gammaproteobacteria bacterium]